MKHLGIDFGLKRVGLSVSDEEGNFAYPLSVVANTPALADEVVGIIKETGAKRVVIGESKDYHLQDNPVMTDIRAFAESLRGKTDADIVFHPEFLTSEEAKRLQGENEMLDASAAAIILKSYLETHGSKGEVETEPETELK